MPRSASPFLMFQGDAQQALELYASVFPSLEVTRRERWAAGEPGTQGSFKSATFVLGGTEWRCFDSPVKHAFAFTPSLSIFVECETEAELDHAFARLSDGGRILMPLGSYGFSTKFGWADDRFGVSWQLNFA